MITERKPSKSQRQEIIGAVSARDGWGCALPGCDKPVDPEVVDGPWSLTIEHWIPQWYGREHGWTLDQIWDLTNLRLAHKKCNAAKGDRVPNEDGTLPPKPQSRFRYRREKRAGRPELCEACNNGHDLAMDEVCANCGCDAQRFPRWAKVKAPDCDHELFWCWACSIGIIERPSAIGIAMRQADSTELGEMFSDD